MCLSAFIGKSQVTLETGYKLSCYKESTLVMHSREKHLGYVDRYGKARAETYRTIIHKENADFCFLYQPRLYWKKLALIVDTEVYFNSSTSISYTPVHVDFKLTLKFTPVPKVVISISHLCIHPIVGDANKFKQRELLRGGYDKLSISYNIK